MAQMSAYNKARHIFAGAMLALATAAQPASAEIIRVGDMLRGMEISQGQCSQMGQAVWVNMHGHGFCIRYYLSTAGGVSGKPIVFLQGDQFGTMDGRTKSFNPPADTKDTDTDNLLKLADSFSKAAKTPAIYLARIGVDGSSGHHRLRRTVLELHTINAALDLIRLRHGYEGFHLVGQSGGSGLIGGLLALRSDIACAVPGAGRLSLLRTARVTGDPTKDYFDPMDAAGMIAANKGARIIVVTDPQDQVVGVQHQVAFVNAMRREGRAIEQYFVQSTDEKHHGVLAYAGRATVMCAQGAPSTRIATDLDLLVKKRMAAAAQARGAAANTPAQMPRQYATAPIVSATPAPVPNSGSTIASGQPLPSASPPRTEWPKLPRRPGPDVIYR